MIDIELSSNQTDLVDAIRAILVSSVEPLTVKKIRARLSAPFDGIRSQELTEVLKRQVAAHVFVICPKYRSAQDRYWDRSLRAHAKVLLRAALADGPMPWAELRRKFPKYLRHLAESVLNEELARGAIHRHPPASPRMGFRCALEPADVLGYAARELEGALARLIEQGFARSHARAAFMQLLQESEWADDAPNESPAPVGVMPVGADQWNTAMF